MLSLGGAGPLAAQEQEPTLAGLKAAFLYQFGNYVEWPGARFGSETAPLVIAVAGDAELARELAAMVRGRTVLGRPVEVRSIRADAAEEELQGIGDAHIVYVGSPAAWLLPALQDRPALLVTGPSRGAPPASMVHFVIEDARLRFDVSLEATARAGLRVSSRLLGVARRVTGVP